MCVQVRDCVPKVAGGGHSEAQESLTVHQAPSLPRPSQDPKTGQGCSGRADLSLSSHSALMLGKSQVLSELSAERLGIPGCH